MLQGRGKEDQVLEEKDSHHKALGGWKCQHAEVPRAAAVCRICVDLELGGEGGPGDCPSQQAFPYWGEMFQLAQT